MHTKSRALTRRLWGVQVCGPFFRAASEAVFGRRGGIMGAAGEDDRETSYPVFLRFALGKNPNPGCGIKSKREKEERKEKGKKKREPPSRVKWRLLHSFPAHLGNTGLQGANSGFFSYLPPRPANHVAAILSASLLTTASDIFDCGVSTDVLGTRSLARPSPLSSHVKKKD